MPGFLQNLVDVTPGSTGSWVDVDLSAYLPANAAGALFTVRTPSGSSPTIGFRKKGSADTWTFAPSGGPKAFGFAAGVDANRTCQINTSLTSCKFYLSGWLTSDDAVFFDNAVAVTPGTTGSFQNVDLTSYVGSDTPLGAILAFTMSGALAAGARMGGSTDNRTQTVQSGGCIVGVDGSKLCQVNIASGTTVYLQGYIKANAIFHTNATDVSLGSTGSYQSLTALGSARAVGGIYEIISTGATQHFWLRENGSTDDFASNTGPNNRHSWIFVGCDGSQLVQGNIDSTSVDFFEVGYFLAPLSLSADHGSYSLGGQNASLKVGRTITAAQGSYSLTGQSATLSRTRKLVAAKGDYALSGQATGLLATRKLVAAKGDFALSGQAASLHRAFSLLAARGDFGLTGYDAGFLIRVQPSLYIPDWDVLTLVAQPFNPDLTVTLDAPPLPSGMGFAGDYGGPGSFVIQGAEVTVYFADNTYYSHAADEPPARWFKALLSWGFNYQMQLFQGAEPGDNSGSRVGTGDVTLANEGGEIDDLLRYGWDGRSLRLYRGKKGDAFSTFELIFVGTGDGLQWTDREVTIRLRDRQAPFAKTLLTELYGGTGGLEGDAGIAGQIKPRLYGRCFNVAPKQIDNANAVFQVAIGPLQSIDAVRDKGVALTPTTDYPTLNALLAASLTGGEYATCNALGIFRVAGQPDGLITADAHGEIVNGTYVETTATIARAIATTRLGQDNFAASDILGVAELDAAQPAPIGWYCDNSSTTARQALDEILGGAGGWWFAGLTGKLEMGLLSLPTGTPSFSLRPRNFQNGISREGIRASYRRQVGWQRNWRPQTPDELAAPPGVSDAERQLYGQEYRWAPAERGQVFTMHHYAQPVQTRSLFALEADAKAEANRLADLYAAERDRYQAPVSGLDPFSVRGGVVAEIADWDVAGLDPGGHLLRVVGMAYDVKSDRLDLTFWG